MQTTRARRRRWRTNVGRRERLVTAVVGGALAGAGLWRRGWTGVALGSGGGVLLVRGLTGHCPVYEAKGIDRSSEKGTRRRARSAVTVDASPEEIYRFWRKLENLPQVMPRIESVRQIGNGRSEWRARGLGDKAIEWKAELTDDVPDRRIAWRSVDGALVRHAGAIEFRPAPGGRGTEVHLEIDYDGPPAVAATPLRPAIGQVLAVSMQQNLRRLKQILEVGEMATVEGQPRGHQRSKRSRHVTHTEGRAAS